MKVLFLFLFIFLTTFTIAQFPPKLFTIYGKIKNQFSGFIKLEYINYEGNFITDSSEVINESFVFKGFIPHPINADIYGDIVFNNTNDINFYSIFIEPGIMHLVLEKDKFKDLKLRGSNTQNKIDSLNNTYINKKIVDSLEKSIFHFDLAYKYNPTSNQFKDSAKIIRLQLDPYYREINLRNENFVLKNIDSYYSVFKLEILLHRLSLDIVSKTFSSYSDEIQNSYYGKRIAANIRGIKGGSPGSKAKNFTAIDIKGNSISLEQFKGKKYVLLDFWATWCKPCRDESPFLIDLNTKFKSKGLEIISIANDDERKEAWVKAIQDDKTDSWTHVLQGSGTVNDLGLLYNIQPIPAKILISKDGTILMRYEGSDGNKSLFDALSKNLK